MRNGALLVLLAGSAVVNGWSLEFVPAWRQALFVAMFLAAYQLGRHLPVTHEWRLLGVVALSAVAAGLAGIADAVDALLSLGAFVTLPWIAGRFRRQQAELVRAATERVEHLERERRFVAERARLLERARIAADMHDALGHELALIALRAGALELASDMTDGNRSAAADLRASAVAAADRLRHTVTGLRTGQSLDELVDRAREAGMTVRLQPGPGADDPAVHRVVQEALTNAARHAPGTAVDIRLERTGEMIVVTVSNPLAEAPPGSGPAGEIAGPGSGTADTGTETAGLGSGAGDTGNGTTGPGSGTTGTGAGTAGTGSGIAGLREHVETISTSSREGTFTVTAWVRAS